MEGKLLSTSNVPLIIWTPTGLIIPAEADVLAGVLADFQAAFGGELNPALETPQGQLASSEAAVISDKNSQIARYVNEVDPQYASGRMQDGIARIYFIIRRPATSTVVTATVTGLFGVVIPAGTLAMDTSGNMYAATGDIIIPISGQTDSEWQCTITGPIACPAGALSVMYQLIPGWDTINNAVDGIPGQNEENRAEFEQRRHDSVAVNVQGSSPSIFGAVASVPGVIDQFVVDNPTGSIVNSGATNYPLKPHSVFVAVLGGTDQDVATAIWSKKNVGCDYNGNTMVTVIDPLTNSFYDVTFERPSPLAVTFQVQIVAGLNISADIVSQIQNAILARFNGQDGTQRERIGGIIFASRYYSAIPGTAILLEIKVAGGDKLQVGIDQYPTLDPNDITVTQV